VIVSPSNHLQLISPTNVLVGYTAMIVAAAVAPLSRIAGSETSASNQYAELALGWEWSSAGARQDVCRGSSNLAPLQMYDYTMQGGVLVTSPFNTSYGSPAVSGSWYVGAMQSNILFYETI
jgi:hypothetical protein